MGIEGGLTGWEKAMGRKMREGWGWGGGKLHDVFLFSHGGRAPVLSPSLASSDTLISGGELQDENGSVKSSIITNRGGNEGMYRKDEASSEQEDRRNGVEGIVRIGG